MLVSPIGKDAFGHLLTSETESIGMRTDGFIQVQDARTAVCNMVLDSAGGLIGGVADMDVIRTLDVTKVRQLCWHSPAVTVLTRMKDHRGPRQTPAYRSRSGREHVPSEPETVGDLRQQAGNCQ